MELTDIDETYIFCARLSFWLFLLLCSLFRLQLFFLGGLRSLFHSTLGGTLDVGGSELACECT